MVTKEHTKAGSESVSGEFVTLSGEEFYVIHDYDRMPPFLMSVVSGSDHWMFLSTTGGLTAGRRNSDSALFPYYTEDKIADNAENTGAKTILRATEDGRTWTWEPFSIRDDGRYAVTRNLYKNVAGTKVYFEEVNHDLLLSVRYGWMTGHSYGIIKHTRITNLGDEDRDIEILDGVQNILPYGVSTATQNEFSCLLDGYKKNERDADSSLAVYRMSSLLSDTAKPSEALRCTTVWTTEGAPSSVLLSSAQLDAFRRGEAVRTETDVRAKRGAYFVHAEKTVSGTADWYIVAEVNQGHDAVFALEDMLSGLAGLAERVQGDADRGTRQLERIVGAADAMQCVRSDMVASHHFANVLFNVMRGGTYAEGMRISTADFRDFCGEWNRLVAERHAEAMAGLPETLTYSDLKTWVTERGDRDLTRLFYEYLPLFFSRRHGDPSRPWNRFSIDIFDENGESILNYEGNWRDIFQNWEALSLSYPAYLPNIVVKFLNATTADGYNPYRITRSGIDWEVPEPENPWSNIGYWSDHQIVYLLRLLEWLNAFDPDELSRLMDHGSFTHADVPYRIKPYRRILENSRDTIEFDWDRHERCLARADELGSDGRLMVSRSGDLLYVSMIEKLLILLTAKLVNYVPGGGIWMNTQRPEWNDANNALAGPGLSVVTLGYLRRYIRLLQTLLAKRSDDSVTVSSELAELVGTLSGIFGSYDPQADFDPSRRRSIMDELGNAGEAYREAVYGGLSESRTDFPSGDIKQFLENALAHVDDTLSENRRSDGLYHSYNLLVRHRDGGMGIRYLYEMLEGQVSILSSGLLSAGDARELIESLYESSMYRPDQDSFMLYPDRRLDRFVEKNTWSREDIGVCPLVDAMLENHDTRIVYTDGRGGRHFNGDLVNADALSSRLDEVAADPRYSGLVDESRETLLDLYEQVFDHNAFTGRSGTFFAYEGLGSIYWHQVAKLLLAVQEQYFESADVEATHTQDADTAGVDAETEEVSSDHDALRTLYYRMRRGLGGSYKTPEEYGAFPMDPYSHTPKGKGAQQPGMTGQVKEEVIARFAELGIRVADGEVFVDPSFLRQDEFLDEERDFLIYTEGGEVASHRIQPGSLAFTYCGVPFFYSITDEPGMTVRFHDGSSETLESRRIPKRIAEHLFARDGQVASVTVHLSMQELVKD